MRADIYDPHEAPNPHLSEIQKEFETWAAHARLSLDRNWYVPYHHAPFTYDELFNGIEETNYYTTAKTQGAWDAWRFLSRNKS
jgi:hypothetical protein